MNKNVCLVLDGIHQIPYNRSMITLTGVPSSDLDTREALQRNLLADLPASSVVLDTCGRFEVYAGTGDPGPEVVDHLFRVAAGLDSAYLGEHQILGQVKRAYLSACGVGALDSGLHRLFQRALRVGKRVRTETDLARGALGHAQTVVELLQALPLPLDRLNLLVIGVNHLNRGILRYLVRRGHHAFILGNRTLDTARQLVTDLGVGEARPLTDLTAVLPHVDVVISATSAPHLIVKAEHLPPQGGPRWFFDLAVPRDIDPDLADRPGTTLYNVTDLERHQAANRRLREGALQAAEAIVAAEVERFFSPPEFGMAPRG